MLAADQLIDEILEHYPEIYRDQLRTDIWTLIKRDRSFLISEVQMVAARCCSCLALTAFRVDLDHIILSVGTDPT